MWQPPIELTAVMNCQRNGTKRVGKWKDCSWLSPPRYSRFFSLQRRSADKVVYVSRKSKE